MKSEIMASEFLSALWEMCLVCVGVCVCRNCEKDKRWLGFVGFRRWIRT